MEDVDIARNTKLERISKIAQDLGIQEEELEQYGKYKAKISPEVYKRLENKENGKLIFLHKILPGPADQSYGIHVAQLAGLPHKVLREATTMLKRLEKQGASELQPASEQLDLFVPEEASAPAISDDEKDVLDEIQNVYLADKTPLQVMELVAQWQQELKDKD